MPKSTSCKSSNKRVIWCQAPDIEKRIAKLIKDLGLSWIKPGKVYCFRSKNSKTKAYARIWGLSRIWQEALGQEPAYIIEVISERFDQLSAQRQEEVLLHEIAHIPQTFSGRLVPHYRIGKRRFKDKVNRLIFSLNKIKVQN